MKVSSDVRWDYLTWPDVPESAWIQSPSQLPALPISPSGCDGATEEEGEGKSTHSETSLWFLRHYQCLILLCRHTRNKYIAGSICRSREAWALGVVMQLGKSTGGCGSEEGEDRCESMWKGEAICSRNVLARGETTQHRKVLYSWQFEAHQLKLLGMLFTIYCPLEIKHELMIHYLLMSTNLHVKQKFSSPSLSLCFKSTEKCKSGSTYLLIWIAFADFAFIAINFLGNHPVKPL